MLHGNNNNNNNKATAFVLNVFFCKTNSKKEINILTKSGSMHVYFLVNF